MTWSIISSLTIYAMVSGWSPGPNNVLLLSTTGQFGFKKCLKLMSGIWTGFLTVMLLCAIFSAGINRLVPNIVPYFKYVGAAYILYLSFQILKRKPLAENRDVQKNPAFITGFLLQFINVKVILYGLSAIISYILPYENSVPVLIFFAFFLTFFGATGNLIWATIGSLCQKFYSRYYKIFNIVMALLLVRCAAKLIL